MRICDKTVWFPENEQRIPVVKNGTNLWMDKKNTVTLGLVRVIYRNQEGEVLVVSR